MPYCLEKRTKPHLRCQAFFFFFFFLIFRPFQNRLCCSVAHAAFVAENSFSLLHSPPYIKGSSWEVNRAMCRLLSEMERCTGQIKSAYDQR